MKKKLSLILAVIILVTSVISGNVFAAFTDVADDNPYREAITTLTKLNIINGYEDNTFRPEGAITRAEFAKIITCAMGYQTIEANDGYFTDVDEHWGKNYINVCAGLNIIAGMGDGTFAPDMPVTYEQALKMVVCTLGYGQFAENEGGWPQGYHIQASELKLNEGIWGTAYTDNAPRGVVAQIVFNALEVEMAEQDIYTGGMIKGTKTILNDFLKVKKLKGILVGVENYKTEDCTKTLGNDMMDVKDTADGVEYVIDYSTYTDDVAVISEYLGKTITVYYRQVWQNDERTLVIIDDETTKNKVTEIKSEEVYDFSGTHLTYYKGNTTDFFSIHPSEISVRYNGKLVSKNDTVTLSNGTNTKNVNFEEALRSWLNPDSEYFIYGTIKFTDSGADNEIDLVEIYDYDTIVALTAPKASEYRIQDKLKTANFLILNPDSPDYEYTITKDGKSVEVTSISANDVILYAKSLDGEVYTLNVTSKPIKGKVTQINGDYETVEIAGEEYSLDKECLKRITETDGRTFEVGTEGTFYADMFGRIVFANVLEEESIPYAYIVSGGIDEATETGYLVAYAPSNTATAAKTYYMAKKVKVNGGSKSPTETLGILKSAAGNSNKDMDKAEEVYKGKKPSFSGEYAQLVKMDIDSSGKVSEIITLSDDTLDDNGNIVQDIVNKDSQKLIRYRSLEEYVYTSSSFKESVESTKTIFKTNSSTTVLFVPMNRERDEFSKKTVSSAFSTSEKYYVEAYDVNEENVAKLVVMYGSDGKITPVSKSTDFSVVASEARPYYDIESGETTSRFSVYKGSTLTPAEWTTYNATEFADVEVGDVIQFAYDNDKLAQDRVNNIKFADIARVLDDENASILYDWTQEQTPDETNNYQSYVFDYRFKMLDSVTKKPIWSDSLNAYKDETYTTTSLGTVEYLRAYVANVSQVLIDSKELVVTKHGFTQNENGEWELPLSSDRDKNETVKISSSTKIIRMDESRKELSRYVQGTETDLQYTDIRDAQNYGTDCSKILVCSLRGTAKLIVIYE